MDEILHLHFEVARPRRRAQHHRAVRVRLLPREGLLVEPARRPVDLDAEPKLVEELVAVRVWPPQPLDAPALGHGRQERTVPEHS